VGGAGNRTSDDEDEYRIAGSFDGPGDDGEGGAFSEEESG
jgi:hypothetical protein